MTNYKGSRSFNNPQARKAYLCITHPDNGLRNEEDPDFDNLVHERIIVGFNSPYDRDEFLKEYYSEIHHIGDDWISEYTVAKINKKALRSPEKRFGEMYAKAIEGLSHIGLILAIKSNFNRSMIATAYDELRDLAKSAQNRIDRIDYVVEYNILEEALNIIDFLRYKESKYKLL